MKNGRLAAVLCSDVRFGRAEVLKTLFALYILIFVMSCATLKCKELSVYSGSKSSVVNDYTFSVDCGEIWDFRDNKAQKMHDLDRKSHFIHQDQKSGNNI